MYHKFFIRVLAFILVLVSADVLAATNRVSYATFTNMVAKARLVAGTNSAARAKLAASLRDVERAKVMRSRAEDFRRRRMEQEAKQVEIIKKYGLDEEKAKALLKELQEQRKASFKSAWTRSQKKGE